MKKAVFYLRVSTRDQNTDNQRLELERVAEAKGWQVGAVYEDQGISGAKGRDKRPSYDRMLKDAVRAKFQVVMAWDVSRMGRSLGGLVEALDELHGNGVDLYLHQQALDTTTPSGKALFQMCGVFAEFERAMISERVKAGLERVRSAGGRLGRPAVNFDLASLQRDHLSGMSVRSLATKYSISIGKTHSTITSLEKARISDEASTTKSV